MPDIVTSKVFVDGEKGITASKLNQIMSGAVIQPSFVSGKPASSTLDPTDQLLEVKGTGSYATITGSQLISSVSAQVDATPQIYSVRLRSFQALSNNTFEVDQRNVTVGTPITVSGTFAQDRWQAAFAGTLRYTTQATTTGVVLPGTNFLISRSYLRVTLTTAQASLAASDHLSIYQLVEGIKLRELANDVHSLQVLVRSSVAGLKFGVSMRDAASVRSLTVLGTIPSANTWVIVPFANLPVIAAGGTWNIVPGLQGYSLNITLAAGSSLIAPANNTFQNGNFIGALGQDNFASNAVNSTFDIAFIQHEPGSQCTTPMDCPFAQNLDDCLRYFQKSYNYGTALGAVTALGELDGIAAAAVPTWVIPSGGRFSKPMAKLPAIGTYDPNNGAANSMFNNSRGTHATVSSFSGTSEKYIGAINLSTAQQAGDWLSLHYSADTGW